MLGDEEDGLASSLEEFGLRAHNRFLSLYSGSAASWPPPGVPSAISQEDIHEGIRRHQGGDFGRLCDDDLQANTHALEHGRRIISAYDAANGTRFWIITKADRSVTTVLLPEEY